MATLPVDLYASYLTYKSDTNQVVSYLAEAAQKCGFSLPNKSNLKGKSRSNGSSGNVIPISLFLPLAERIAGNTGKATAPPPRHVVLALDRAIATRKEHNLYHKLDGAENQSPQPTAQHQDGVDTHLHFVNVLEQVRKILRPLYPVATQPSVTPIRRISLLEQALNRFRHLSVEQPTASTIPELPNFVASPIIETKYEAEAVDDYDEAFMAFCLLVDDLNEVRDVLRKSWKAYIWQNTDLASVSVVTDNAIAMVQQNVEDFGLRFPKHADLALLVNDMFISHCKALDVDITSSSTKPPFDSSAAVCADTSFLWIQTLWEDTRHGKSSTVPVKKAPSWEAQTVANARTKYKEQNEFLTSFLSEYRQLAKTILRPIFRKAMPMLDSLTTILAMESEAKYTSFLALFAMQVFLDIREELGSHCDRGFDDLVHCVTALQDEAKEHQTLAEYYNMYQKRYWSADYASSFNTKIRKSICLIQHDFFAAMVTDGDDINVNDLSFGDTRDKLQFSFLRQHPWLCGVLAFTAQSDALNLGLELANAHFVVVPAAHLYNTLLQQKYLQEDWPDIEHLMKQQGHLFFGGRPSSLRDCLKKYALATGVSAAAYSKAPSRRNGAPSRNEKNRRKLGLDALPVTRTLVEEHQRDAQPLPALINSAKVLKSLHGLGKSRGFDPSKTKISDWLKLLLHNVHHESTMRQFSYLLMDRVCRHVLLLSPAVLADATATRKLLAHTPQAFDIRDLEDEVGELMSTMLDTASKPSNSESWTILGDAFASELGADDDGIGITTSTYATYHLAHTMQHGGSPDLRILFKTILLTHAATDESLEDIDNYFNNRGGDSMLKRLAPGEKLLGFVERARAEDKMAIAKYARSTLASAGTSKVKDRSSPTKPGAAKLQGSQAAATKPKAPKTMAEFFKGLPASDKSFPAVDVKAMCRELAEDGVLDALEQAMLMRTGR